MTVERTTCEIVDDRLCEGENVGRTVCYRCGLPACKQCSSIVTARVLSKALGRVVLRRMRQCANCQDEEKRFAAMLKAKKAKAA